MTRNTLLWFVSQMLPARLARAKFQTTLFSAISALMLYALSVVSTLPVASVVVGGTMLIAPQWAHASGCCPTPSGIPVCSPRNYYLCSANYQRSSGGPGSVGDPIDVATGNVFLHVTDYRTAGQNPLELTRYYISNAYLGTAFPTTLGPDWRTTYDRYLRFSPSSSPTTITAERADGEQIVFQISSGVWKPHIPQVGGLALDQDYRLVNTSGSTWTLTDHNDTVEVFNDLGTGEGQLQTITLRNGYTQTMYYTAVSGCAGGSELCSVRDSYGRTLNFSYTSGLLTGVTTPDTLALNYTYTTISGYGSIVNTVSYNTSPMATSQTYNYGVTATPLLTSITDENGNTSASWGYDSNGRAKSSQQGGTTASPLANATMLTYNTSGTTTVTNAYGVADTYSFDWINNGPKVLSISRAASSGGCGGSTATATETFTYDSNGYLASKTDWNDGGSTNPYLTTSYNNDNNGDPYTSGGTSAIVEAQTLGGTTTTLRTIDISYDTNWPRLPHCITTAGNTVAFIYTSSSAPADLQTRAETDTTASGSTPCSTTANTTTRVWGYSWGSGANIGLLTQVSGPLSGQTTTLAYPTSGSNTGTLTSITDALSHSTSFSYPTTTATLPTTIIDQNGVTTTLAYDGRLNLTTRTLDPTPGANLVTTYMHDYGNRLTQVTLPDSSYLQYGYDAANRRTLVTNALGECIVYTLDSLGDTTEADIKSPVSSACDATHGTLGRKHTAGFDNLGRITSDVAWTTGSTSNTTLYTYDANGNALTIVDPRSNTTTRTFDALNRPIQVNDRDGNNTYITYDEHNAVTSVKDPNTNTTSYTRDGFGRVTKLGSPDSGTTYYTYDLADNLTKKVDGANVETDRTFDLLNRELTRQFPGNTAENVYKTYDQTGGYGYGIGHLTTMYDPAQTLSIKWDERGNDIEEIHTTGATTYTVSNYYDAASRLYATMNPDGWIVGWNRDAAGQVNAIGISAPPSYSSTAWIVGNNSTSYITHEPFGPAISVPFQNGVTRVNAYDLDYKLTRVTDSGTSPVLDLSYGYDANGNVTGITDHLHSTNTQTMTYEPMDRLYTATGNYGSYTWGWDANGNKNTEMLGSTTDTYSYTSGTNQLTGITGSAYGFSYPSPNAGEITGISVSGSSFSTLPMNQSEQSASVTFTGYSSPAVSYTYNGFGQRFQKSASVATSYFYGPVGQLFEETNGLGSSTVSTDYIPLDPNSPRDGFYPVAMMATTGTASASPTEATYYIHADRIGTPQTVTDSSQTPQWATTYSPFGATPTPSPNSVTMNLRLPGMYSDPETQLYHNGAREYAPVTGRYMQTDPIGLNGGTNTYTYALDNPFGFTDVWGLDPSGNASDSTPQQTGGDGSSGGGTTSPQFPPSTGDGGGYNVMFTFGGTVILGPFGTSPDFGIGADTQGRVCLIVDSCAADNSNGYGPTVGLLLAGGVNGGINSGTFTTGSSTTTTIQNSVDLGFIGVGGFSVGEGDNGQFNGYARGFGGEGLGGGVGRWKCVERSYCSKAHF